MTWFTTVVTREIVTETYRPILSLLVGLVRLIQAMIREVSFLPTLSADDGTKIKHSPSSTSESGAGCRSSPKSLSETKPASGPILILHCGEI